MTNPIAIILMIASHKNISVNETSAAFKTAEKSLLGFSVGASSDSWMQESMMRQSMSISNVLFFMSMNSNRRSGRRGLMNPSDGYLMHISSLLTLWLLNQSSSSSVFLADFSTRVSSTTTSLTGSP